MKRAIIFIAILMSAMATKAQFPLFTGPQVSGLPAFRTFNQATDSSNHRTKWSFAQYSGISARFVAFRGGGGSFLSAPLGLQVNRQLANNVYAFGGISVTPSLFQGTGPAFFQPGLEKGGYNFMQPNRNFSINPAAQIGVMYISNDKTFSVSGSISVSRSSYNGYYPLYTPTAF